MAPRPPSVIDAANSVFVSIETQRNQSLQRIEQNALPIQEWLKTCLESRTQQVINLKKEESKQPAKKKSKTEAPLDQNILDYIYSLRVKDLQGHLAERGLEVKGLKKDLQRRLIAAMEQDAMAEVHSSPGSSKASGSSESSSRPLLGEVKQAYSSDMDKDELEFRGDDEEIHVPVGDVEEIEQPSVIVHVGQPDTTEASKRMDTQQEKSQKSTSASSAHSPKQQQQQQRPRSPLRHIRSGVKSVVKALSPSKQKSSVGDMIDKIESGIKAPREDQIYSSASSDDDAQTRATAPAAAKVMETPHGSMRTGPARVMTAGGTVASKPMRSAPGISKTLKAAQEARRAKLAEIRSKSKPAISAATAANSTASFSKVKPFSVQSSSKASTQNGNRSLASQMREKVATLQKTEKQSSTYAQLKKNAPSQDVPRTENGPSQDAEMRENSPARDAEMKENSPNKVAQLKENSTNKALFGSFNSLQSGVSRPSNALNEVTNSPGVAKMKSPSPAKPASPLMSPMDTYELSDREQSDSDSEDEEYTKPKKRIPQWAQKSNLMPALEHQFTQANHDPDKIFGEVHTCDLQAIFDQKKARYQRRTSSGNWTQDRATAAEKLAYKRSQGYGGEE